MFSLSYESFSILGDAFFFVKKVSFPARTVDYQPRLNKKKIPTLHISSFEKVVL